MELRLLVLVHLPYLGSYKKNVFQPMRPKEWLRKLELMESVGAEVRRIGEWQRVGCLLCHNAHIYCPVVLCRTTGLLSLLVQ